MGFCKVKMENYEGFLFRRYIRRRRAQRHKIARGKPITPNMIPSPKQRPGSSEPQLPCGARNEAQRKKAMLAISGNIRKVSIALRSILNIFLKPRLGSSLSISVARIRLTFRFD